MLLERDLSNPRDRRPGTSRRRRPTRWLAVAAITLGLGATACLGPVPSGLRRRSTPAPRPRSSPPRSSSASRAAPGVRSRPASTARGSRCGRGTPACCRCPTSPAPSPPCSRRSPCAGSSRETSCSRRTPTSTSAFTSARGTWCTRRRPPKRWRSRASPSLEWPWPFARL